ncbi:MULTISPECIES: hypothetical protein [unclassified Coleofasciculus]|uniref:hypothetical protein n=1 Tax=unclassified Coleofasciculus TaxID=2692782 RepID=UPI001D13E013|nr:MULTISPECIES: hypothetical protein [unclassified Coleofasciculus]
MLIIQDTVLKREPIQSSLLPSYQLQEVPAGTLFVLQSYTPPDSTNHIRLSLEDIAIKGSNMNWYAFAKHVQITREPLRPVESVTQMLSQKIEKDVVKMTVYRQTLPLKSGLIKLVFNVDTVIKRAPTQSAYLAPDSMQEIPAGTELMLLTDKPDAYNTVKLPIRDSHIRFTLKDLELKGFQQDWYAFNQHVGLQLVG